MNALRIAAHTLKLSLIITLAVALPINYSYAHHINKNAPPGPIKITAKKKKVVKKSIDKKLNQTKKAIVKKVDVQATDKTTNKVQKEKITVKVTKEEPNETIEIKTVKPIVAKAAVDKTVLQVKEQKISTVKKRVTSTQIAAKNNSKERKNNTETTAVSPIYTNEEETTFIDDKKTQGALIGGVVLGAATASPVGLVLGGLGGYMVGKGEEADIENQKREAEKQKVVKPAPLHANYQVCKKMAKSKARTQLPFCFYSMK